MKRGGWMGISILAKGKDHPDIVKALEDLRAFTGTVKQTYKQLEQDYRAWYATVKQLKKLTDDDRTELRQIMCTEGEYTMAAKVNEVADRWYTDCDNRVRPGSGCRLDCVLTGSKRSIHEIKPKTPRGEAEAKEQLTSYEAGLRAWYKRDRAGLMSSYSKLSECEKGDGDARDLDLEALPEFYDFCPSSNDEVGDSFEPQEGDVDTELQR